MTRWKTIGLALAAAILLVAAAALLWLYGPFRPYRHHLSGMPPTLHRENLYSEAGAGRLSLALHHVAPLVFVPEIRSNEVSVIDPKRLRVVARFPAGRNPQHVVPSYDLRTLWVAGSAAPGHGKGSLMPIDAISGQPGRAIRCRMRTISISRRMAALPSMLPKKTGDSIFAIRKRCAFKRVYACGNARGPITPTSTSTVNS